ncbi:flavocytochrome c [Anoxynatronum sibiricum]|uniref:Flavocytochrome c n=1 Tax=Anoxynatronum sibiricum TaxID=210623 RepID=A0ABU9VRY3_9CLOT
MLKKHTKGLSFLMAILLMMTLLSGCGGSQPAAPEAPAEVEAPAETETEADSADLTTDVVIIGAGGAGLAAAIEAHDAGKEVIVVEQMPIIGGNTLRATGGLNAAGTSSQEAAGIEDDADVHYEDTMKGGYELNDPSLVRILADEAGPAVEWLIGLGADLSDVGRLGGSSNNRSHRPTGGAPVGAHLVEVLRTSVEDRGIEIKINTKAVEILKEGNAVTGILVEDNKGDTYQISAKAVIVATGGFGANSDMFADYDASLTGFGSTNHPGADGVAILMAQAAGAALIDMEQIQTHPTVVPEKGYMITEAVRGNGAILINRNGERFTNEIGTRDVVSEAMLAQEGATGFLFFDEGIRESLSAIEGYIRQGFVTEAGSLEEMAELMDMDAAVLTATVEAYNAAVAAGNDEAFGRDDMPRTLETAGYYLIEVGPAVHHTMGGIHISPQAEVLDESGSPIPGLFAAGEVTGGIHGGNRLGGNALADLMVFGRIAGKSAAK